MITYYTDGSCTPNPGPGGFAVIRDMKPYLMGSHPDSTNIRMEGSALIAALEDAAGQPCEIHTDSEFWINVITKWSLGWEKNGWRKKGGEIKNIDLVRQASELYRNSKARLVWVRGHNNDPGNELADLWANTAREKRLQGRLDSQTA
jgi:ribonuclease HI